MVAWNSLLIAAALLVVPLPQTPVFKANADVVLVDVQILDRSGEPVSDLTLAEFTLKVDGKVRPIVSAEFQRVGDRSLPAKAPTTTLPSIAVPPAASYVMFVVDPGAMRPEPARILFDQAAQFMSTLSPNHVVGLVVAPSRVVRLPFSTLRQPVAAELRRQGGSFSGGTNQAQVVGTLSAIEAGLDALRSVDGRRSLVYFGDSFPEYAAENARETAWHANAADVAIHVIASDALAIPNITSRTPPQAPRLGGDFGALALFADLTGGTFYRRVVTGAMVFDRLERELSAQYVLTFDVQSSDRDGKRHTINVAVNRKGMDVRFRREFAR